MSWAKTLLYDFKDIDGYLINPDKLFLYLKEVKALERWDLEAKNKTELINKQLIFWEKLPAIYKGFYDYLTESKKGHSGLIQRECTIKLNTFLKNNNQYFVFGGFNALNNAEQNIFQTILNEKKGEVLWDIDDYFLNDDVHLAAYFINHFKSNWFFYKNNPIQEVFNNYQTSKNIYIYKTIKTIGQAKLIGHIIDCNDFNLNQTAIVLPDETLLLPLLNHLPEKIEALNITMGYPATNNPIQFLIHDIFVLHNKAKLTKNNQSLFYFRHVIAVLQNPFLVEIIETRDVINYIKAFNINYISFDKIKKIAKTNPNNLLDIIFGFSFKDNQSFLDNLLTIIKIIKQYKDKITTSQSKIDLAFVFGLYQIINQLKLYLSKYTIENDCRLLFDLYQDQVSQAQVSFEGQPLEGLQIMGMLESRMLDFETLIIPSCNEGILPPKPRQQSIVPFDIKKEEGMPTQLEQDALITYHFYRLISRAKHIYLIYDGDEGQGLSSGERSRFIEQIVFDALPNHQIVEKSFVPDIQLKPIQSKILKTDEVNELLKNFAEKGFSASSFSNYLRNPKVFFVNNLLRVNDSDEVEEDIALNTLGTIIHITLEKLYRPFVGQKLNESILNNLISTFENELKHHFQEIFKEGDITKGKNLIAYEISKKQIKQFLLKELEAIINGEEIVLLALEQNYKIKIEDDRFPYPVYLKGNLDRVERRNGVLCVIDYKTGKVTQADLNLNEAKKDHIFDLKTEKIMQLLCYSLLLEAEYEDENIQAGIISFRHLNAYAMMLTEKSGRTIITDKITTELKETFKEQLKDMIWEIVNPDTNFEDLS